MMRTLWLDYQRPRPVRRWLGWCLLGLSLAASAELLNHWLGLDAENELLKEQTQLIQRKLARQQVHSVVAKEDRISGELAQQVVQHGSEAWADILDSLENVADESVTLVSIATESNAVVLNGEAKSLEQLMDYQERVRAKPRLASAHVLSYEVIKGMPLRPVSFVMNIDAVEGAR